MIQTEL